MGKYILRFWSREKDKAWTYTSEEFKNTQSALCGMASKIDEYIRMDILAPNGTMLVYYSGEGK